MTDKATPRLFRGLESCYPPPLNIATDNGDKWPLQTIWKRIVNGTDLENKQVLLDDINPTSMIEYVDNYGKKAVLTVKTKKKSHQFETVGHLTVARPWLEREAGIDYICPVIIQHKDFPDT